VSTLVATSVPLNVDGDGALERDVRVGAGQLLGVKVEIGTLNTISITLKDEPDDVTLLDVSGVNADTRYTLAAVADNIEGGVAPVIVWGRIHVHVEGADASTTGRLVLLVNR
jgi:hypothetical protein